MRNCLLVVLALAALACNDRTRTVPTSSNPLQPDLGIVADAGYDEPVRGLCVPGSRRCVTENSPLFEACSPTGTTFYGGSCDDGEVCREGACEPFSCVPGRPLCVGATTAAVCDASGVAVQEATSCEDANVCIGGTCVDPCAVAREARSYITCEYAAHELPNLFQDLATTRAAPFAVVLANPAPLVSSRVTITDRDRVAGLREPFRLQPGPSYGVGQPTDLRSEVLLSNGTSRAIESAADVEIPPGAAGVFLMDGSGVYEITATRPVVAYQFSPYCCNFTATNDASLLLPISSRGLRYRALGYPAWRLGDAGDWLQPYLSIVSEVATTVRVQSPVALHGRGVASATDIEFQLEPREPVLLYTDLTSLTPSDTTEGDFSGAVIEADDPIGVFTGHPCTFVPTDQWACDHLEEALLPADILGSRYVLTPVRRRSEHDISDPNFDVREGTYWRIVADEEATLRFDPPLAELQTLSPSNPSSNACTDEMSLAAGEFCEFGTVDPTTLNSSGALIVGGVISGHESTGVRYYGKQAGDPSLFVLPPVEQFRSSYAFVTPQTFLRTYVTVAAAPAVPITLDGRSVPEDQRLERRVVELEGRQWEVFTIAIDPGVHTMASDTRFGIVVYAYDDYVSYAFTGGLDLVPKGTR